MCRGSLIYTGGHSDRPAEAFLSLLEQADVRTLVDVRAWSASHRHPQFAREALDGMLTRAGIAYVWLGRELGGHRRPIAGSPHVALAPGVTAVHALSPLVRVEDDRLVYDRNTTAGLGFQ